MIIAIELQPDLIDTKRTEEPENIMQFALIGRGESSESLCIDSTVRKDVARSLIAHNVNALVTRHIPLESFVLLKSYGVRVYSGLMKPMSIHDVVEACKTGELTEITSANYHALMQNGAPVKVGCSPTSSGEMPGIKEAL